MAPPTLRGTARVVGLLAMASIYLGIGTLHFLRPEGFVQIVPPFVPWPLATVYVSGVAELALGIGLLVPRTRALAAWGVVALLIAVFPANLYHWWGDVAVGGQTAPPLYHALRLPMQAVLIAWAALYVRGASPDAARANELRAASTR